MESKGEGSDCEHDLHVCRVIAGEVGEKPDCRDRQENPSLLQGSLTAAILL